MSEPDPVDQGTDSIEATRSGRHIKRKRFDDEIVESSLGVTAKVITSPTTPAVAVVHTSTMPATIQISQKMESHQALSVAKPSVGPDANDRIEQINSFEGSDDDIDEWKPSDDFILMQSVLQICDLKVVHECIQFSYPFSLSEITSRWKYLLHTPSACSFYSKLHPTTLVYLQRKVPLSRQEEAVLAKVTPQEGSSLQKFQTLQEQNRSIFLPCRTAKSLQKHWKLMRQKYLLDTQIVPSSSHGNEITSSLSDYEDSLPLQRDKIDFDLDYELRQLQRAPKREMRRLESELPFWQTLSESITNRPVVDFDDQTLAVLRGRLVRYLMRSREISLGRASNEVTVDVDFSLEGPAFKISRRQAIIKLRNNGEFVFANEGKLTVYINGNPVLTGNKSRLNHNAILELAGLRFVFLVNHKLTLNGLPDQDP